MFIHGLIGPFNENDTFNALHPRVSSFVDLNGYGNSIGMPVTTELQVEALHRHILTEHPGQAVHLVAHSIGAVWAFTLAARFPELVASLATVEGNFSLADAFWSSSIAALTAGEAELAVQESMDDATSWLKSAGVSINAVLVARAETALAYQPWQTVWQSAKAVISITGAPEYELMLREVFSKVPVHLIAGEHSAAGWHVPKWARDAAQTDTVIPSVGHMMMLQDPTQFAAVLASVLH